MRDGPSRDKRRLAAGLVLMALTFATSLIGVFALGRPSPGGGTAPGVVFLVASGWVLVAAAALLFHRSYPGGPGGDDPRPAPGSGPPRADAGEEAGAGDRRPGAPEAGKRP